jgi:uncharacterized membrane protein YjgN (DUF898 family)
MRASGNTSIREPRMSTSTTHPHPVPPSGQRGRELPFVFHGKGGEYFRIWIVNILLSILTLGIYSAWAKVRNKQYFYGSTELDGATFTYDARPMQILKGRLLVLGAFVLLSIVSGAIPELGLILPLLILVLMPFFIQRSLRFNARYSSYRNVRFGFDGGCKEIAIILYGWPVLFMLGSAVLMGLASLADSEALNVAMSGIIGLAYVFGLLPYLFYRFKRMVIGNSRYGIAPFAFDAGFGQFAVIVFQTLAWTFLLMLLFAFVMQMTSGSGELLKSIFDDNVDPSVLLGSILPMILLVSFLFMLLASFPYIYFMVHTNNLVFNHCGLDSFRFRANYELVSWGLLYLGNTFLTLITLGLFWPFAKVRMARYRAQHTSVLALESLDGFSSAQAEQVGALGEAVSDFYDFDFGF